MVSDAKIAGRNHDNHAVNHQLRTLITYLVSSTTHPAVDSSTSSFTNAGITKRMNSPRIEKLSRCAADAGKLLAANKGKVGLAVAAAASLAVIGGVVFLRVKFAALKKVVRERYAGGIGPFDAAKYPRPLNMTDKIASNASAAVFSDSFELTVPLCRIPRALRTDPGERALARNAGFKSIPTLLTAARQHRVACSCRHPFLQRRCSRRTSSTRCRGSRSYRRAGTCAARLRATPPPAR